MAAAYFVQDLRNELGEDEFYRHFANASDGQAAVLSYSFLTSVPDGTTNYHGDPHDGFRPYTAAEKATVRQALDIFESVANVHFNQTNGDPDLQVGAFAISGDVGGYANYALYNKSTDEIVQGVDYGEVWLDTDYIKGNLQLVLHEVGHSLGLEHPFEGNFQLPTAEDNKDNTVMSYTGFWGDTLGIYDIAALQSIYGPAHRRMGNDRYVFGADKLIWDGGGKDQITAANASAAVTIDLHDGSWNYMGTKAASFLDDQNGKQVYLGNFTTIENLTGSRFSDHLTGNEVANTISAGVGLDSIEGDGGGDKLRGGAGADTFVLAKLEDSTVDASGRDFIRDFNPGQHDRIDLRALDADAGADLDQVFSFIEKQQFSQHAGELNYTFKGTHTVVSGDVNGDGEADFSILIRGHVQLHEGDFML